MFNTEFLFSHLSPSLLIVAAALKRALTVSVLLWRKMGHAALC